MFNSESKWCPWLLTAEEFESPSVRSSAYVAPTSPPVFTFHSMAPGLTQSTTELSDVDGNPFEFNVDAQLDGTYLIRYVPFAPKAAQFVLSVTFAAKPIQGSPFKVTVADPPKSAAFSAGDLLRIPPPAAPSCAPSAAPSAALSATPSAVPSPSPLATVSERAATTTGAARHGCSPRPWTAPNHSTAAERATRALRMLVEKLATWRPCLPRTHLVIALSPHTQRSGGAHYSTNGSALLRPAPLRPSIPTASPYASRSEWTRASFPCGGDWGYRSPACSSPTTDAPALRHATKPPRGCWLPIQISSRG